MTDDRVQSAVLPLPEGDVVVQWPRSMSRASFAEMEALLTIVMRRAKRSLPEELSDDR